MTACRSTGQPIPLSGIHGGDDSTRLLWFEIGDNPVNRLLGRDSEDSTILVGARQIVAEQVLDKTANGRETTIACYCGISPLGFDMIQEGEHGICLEIIEAQISYGLTSALRAAASIFWLRSNCS